MISLIGRSWSQRAAWFSSNWPFLVEVDLGDVLFRWPRLLLLANSEFLRLQPPATGGLSGCVVIGFGRRNFWGEADSTLAEAACFCVCCGQIGGFAAANFGGFGGGATLATGVVCVLGRGGFH